MPISLGWFSALFAIDVFSTISKYIERNDSEETTQGLGSIAMSSINFLLPQLQTLINEHTTKHDTV